MNINIIAAAVGVAIAMQAEPSFAAHGGGGGGDGGMIMMGGHGMAGGGAHFGGAGFGGGDAHFASPGFGGGPHIAGPGSGGAHMGNLHLGGPGLAGGGFGGREPGRFAGVAGAWHDHGPGWRDRYDGLHQGRRDYGYATWPGYDTYYGYYATGYGNNCANVLANPATYPASEYRWCLANY